MLVAYILHSVLDAHIFCHMHILVSGWMVNFNLFQWTSRSQFLHLNSHWLMFAQRMLGLKYLGNSIGLAQLHFSWQSSLSVSLWTIPVLISVLCTALSSLLYNLDKQLYRLTHSRYVTPYT